MPWETLLSRSIFPDQAFDIRSLRSDNRSQTYFLGIAKEIAVSLDMPPSEVVALGKVRLSHQSRPDSSQA